MGVSGGLDSHGPWYEEVPKMVLSPSCVSLLFPSVKLPREAVGYEMSIPVQM